MFNFKAYSGVNFLFNSSQYPFGLSLSKPNTTALRQAQGERKPSVNREVFSELFLSRLGFFPLAKLGEVRITLLKNSHDRLNVFGGTTQPFHFYFFIRQSLF